jgi:hypothetical protein
MMEFTHYSQKPLTLDILRAWQPTGPKHDHMPFKPKGLWLSVDGDDDWAAWCQSEEFGLDRYLFSQKVTLSGNPQGSNSLRLLFDRMGTGGVLHIPTVYDFDAFSEIYAMSRYPGSRNEFIDWRLVQQKYDGIIIAPYQWSRRLADGFIWYYPWDCASGCIWNTDVIQSIGPSSPVKWETCSYEEGR